MARLVRIVVLALCVGAFLSPPSASGLGLSVSGNRLVDESGQATRLLGVSRSGLGQTDCRHDYIDKWMRWADRRGISYFGWAWDAKGGWTCHAGPSLIQHYRGKPTGVGVGFRDHLLKLRRHARR